MTRRTGRPAGRPANRPEDVWEHIDQSGGPDACWPWQMGTKHGYGAWTLDAQSVLAHRVAWAVANGPIPDGLNVLHRCDNPPCCNPAHLFLGTLNDNNQDMFTKGRGKADTHAAKHGTYSGYLRHVRGSGDWTMPACQPCRDANAAYRRERNRALTDNAKTPDSSTFASVSNGPDFASGGGHG